MKKYAIVFVFFLVALWSVTTLANDHSQQGMWYQILDSFPETSCFADDSVTEASAGDHNTTAVLRQTTGPEGNRIYFYEDVPSESVSTTSEINIDRLVPD